ncbi:hypothetical protein ACOJUR_00340 [Alicyclobacillus tolerans]|uniref:ATPase F0F1 n=1 Tax=Alicyclobacillus tolerans TaxID=90970 RepID=A0ABT9LU31_9BACL|nr:MULTISPECIES: hypothetical protein [Alicyclobacillus]MDP9727765.1 hypothetical protein [Alicyclobacillus tengchongensis]
MWKTFAVYSGATMQLAVSVIVFGYLGHRLAVEIHQMWLTFGGVLLGVAVGVSGLAFLIKKLLGDESP